MKHQHTVIGVVLVLLGFATVAIWWQSRARTAENAGLSAEQGTQQLQSLELQTPAELAAVRERSTEASSEALDADVDTVVTGRLVYADATRLSEQTLVLSPVDRALGSKSTAIHATCDREGRFRIAGLVPGVVYQLLVPVSQQTTEIRRFLNGMDLPLPLPGVVDLGSIECTLGSSVVGSVRDAAGAPIHGAEIHGDWTLDLGTLTDDKGCFTVYGMRAGSASLWVSKAGYLDSSALRVTTLAEPTTQVLPPIVLQQGVQIRGQIRDPLGMPIDGAVVECQAQRGLQGRHGTRTTSEQDGSFAVSTNGKGKHWLKVWHGDFALWDQTVDPTDQVEPLAVELIPLENHVFRVLDADTGLPLADFLTRYLPGGARGGFPQILPVDSLLIEVHAIDGIFERKAQATVDAIEVSAPGYQTVREDVGEARPFVQTLRLQRGWRLTGRVLHAGKPAYPCMGILVPQNTYSEPNKDDFLNPVGLKQGPIGSTRSFLVDEAGNMVISGLDVERYDLRLTAPGKGIATASVDRQHPDLGELALVGVGRIVGKVLAPEGFNVEQVRIRTTLAGSASVSANGEFVLEEVPEGECSVGVYRINGVMRTFAPGISMEGMPPEVAARMKSELGEAAPSVLVHSGQTSQVTVDIRPLLVKELRLRLVLGEEPFDDGTIMIGSSSSKHGGKPLGDGWYQFELQPNQEYSLVHFGHGQTYPIAVTPTTTELEVVVPVGQLRFVLPDGVQVPEDGGVTLVLKSVNQTTDSAIISTHTLLRKSAQPVKEASELRWDQTTGQITARSIAEGTYQATLTIQSMEVTVSGKGFMAKSTGTPIRCTGTVKVRPFETTDWRPAIEQRAENPR